MTTGPSQGRLLPSVSPSTAAMRAAPPRAALSVSVVVPVYQGETTLEALVAEIDPLTRVEADDGGRRFRVNEVILVHDGAIDGSDAVMLDLAERYPFVTPIWLSRNFGQHPATLAGMANTSGDWVVTLDEDGQQDPADIARLLDRADETGARLVYARPSNEPPHGWVRNRASATAKWLFSRMLEHPGLKSFNSFRLIDGEIARSLAAYCGPGVYLDVALSWVVARSAECPVRLRGGSSRPSGYGYRKLFSHFWRLVLTSGTRPLRLVALLGVVSIVIGLVLAGYALWGKLTGRVPIAGWTSLMVAVSLFSGVILFTLGVFAEYLGVALTMALGKPLFLIVSRPSRGGGRP